MKSIFQLLTLISAILISSFSVRAQSSEQELLQLFAEEINNTLTQEVSHEEYCLEQGTLEEILNTALKESLKHDISNIDSEYLDLFLPILKNADCNIVCNYIIVLPTGRQTILFSIAPDELAP